MFLEWVTSLTGTVNLLSVFAGVGGVMAALYTFKLGTQSQRIETETLSQLKRAWESLDKADFQANATKGHLSSTTPPVDAELGARLKRLDIRLTRIEARLPDHETADKIASVNDAILATQFENLSRRLDRLDQDAMSTGKVMSLILAVLNAVAGLLAVATWPIGEIIN